MGYPALTRDNADKLVARLRQLIQEGNEPVLGDIVESDYVQLRTGDEYRPTLLSRCGEGLRDQWNSPQHGGLDEFKLEARMAIEIHAAVSHLGMDMREDEDFWRYLALFPLRWYLIAREPELQPQDYGGTRVLPPDENGNVRRVKTQMINQLIFRSYLWGKISVDEETGSYSRATLIDERGGPSIDIWHSHMIRTQLGQLGSFPHAFLDVVVSEIADGEKMKDPARKLEKLLARLKHGVLFDVHSYSDAVLLTQEQFGRLVD